MSADITFAGRLDAVRSALVRLVGETVSERPRSSTGVDGLAHVAARCRLSDFERDALVLAAGVEVDDDIARLAARAQPRSGMSIATFGLALRALDAAHWDALGPDAPLQSLALVHLDRRTGGVVSAGLRVDDRVLLALLGLDGVDEQLAAYADALAPGDELLPATHRHLLDRVAEGSAGSMHLRGRPSAASAFVRALAARLGAPRAWQLAAGAIPADVDEFGMLVRRLAREHRLTSAPIVVNLDDPDPSALRFGRRLAHRLAGAGVPVVVSSRDPVSELPVATHVVELEEPSAEEYVAVWREALGPAAISLNGSIEQLAGQFRLAGDQLRAIAAETIDDTTAGLPDRLWEACRTRARADLDGLAQRIVPSAGWNDLVLPDRERAALRDLLRHARHRATVFEHWQVSSGTRGGRGIGALFAGPSGTGKSLAAEVIAAELRVDVYRVDLSAVVSKYIGETEKNLRRVTDAAEASGAVLVFDEADALFGQRSEVKDSHDRYANIEVSYLLQRMESYRGLAVLTTNLRANIDDAFVRRLAFIVTFPFPDAPARQDLWARAFGARTPVAPLDTRRLAQLTLAGGSIRNVAVHAAFLAAERGNAVTMSDLLRGARSEYEKLDRPLTPTELAGWAV